MDLANMIQKAFKFTTPTQPSVKRSRLESARVHFTITAYTVIEPDGTGQRKEVKSLEAGKCYEIIVLCERSRNQSDQLDCLIVEDCELSLQAAYTLQVSYQPLPCKTIAVAYKDISQPKYQLPAWSLDIPDDLPTCELTLSLTIKEPSFHPKDNISSQDFHIQGHTILENTQLLAASNIATGLPENAAVLTIASENAFASSNEYTIKTSNRYIRNLKTFLNASFISGVAQQFPEKASIAKIMDTILTFSRDHAGELMAWLRQFRTACSAHQQRPCLIIVDTTGTLEIPWELLEIETYAYLGAIAQVVRWYPFKPFGKPKLLEIKQVVYEGSVLAYLDQQIKHTEREHAILSRVIKEDLPDWKTLRQRLSKGKGLTDVGLIYIASHGQEGKVLGNDTLQQPNHRLRALELARMPEHPEPRPIFFVNACDSARMLRDSKTNPSSFAESFLVQCASNYIGTMAPVGSNRASLIAQSILEQAVTDDGVQIAEALRVLRTQVVEKLRDCDPEDCPQKELDQELFFTFMYVYYGNPLARLRLRPVSSEKEGT